MTDPRVLHLLLLLPPLLLQRATASCPPCDCTPHAFARLLDLPDQPLPTVNCSGLHLTAMPRDSPPPADTAALLLQDNDLTDLFGQLPPLPSLLLLDLSRNRVTQRGRGAAFAGLGRLQLLDLSRNDFRTVFSGVFRGCHLLRHLRMTHAQVRFIEEHVFDGLRELRTLHLSHNQLNAIFPEWFRDLGQLRELQLQGNHISYVNGGCFSTLGNLRSLSLNGNRIRGVSDHAFDGLANLTELHVEDNLLVRVPSASFRATENIKVLRLGGNLFTELQTGDFVHLALEEAFVENVPDLTLIDKGAFWDLPYLKTLHLHHNAKLRFIDAQAFINVPNLRILSLHGNNLSAIGEDVVQTFQRPLQISLHDNPLVCDCNVKWIHDIVRQNDSGRIRILSADTVLCDQPSDVRSTPLRDLSPSRIPDNCPPVIVGPSNSTVDRKIGDKHVFQCRAHGIPVPSIHWILPSGAVLNQTSNDVRLKGPGSLGIYHIKPQDAGPYVCIAENPMGEAASVSHLSVENIDINLFPLGVASTFVTVVWNGTARNAFPEYEIVYRKEGGPTREYQSVTVSQFFRSYTINNLRPRSTYKFCIGIKSKEDKQYVQFSCTWVRTRDESFMLQGIHRTSNVAVAVVLAILASMMMVVCVVTVAARKYRQRHYDTPEKSLVGNMAQIHMENLHSPLMSHVGS